MPVLLFTAGEVAETLAKRGRDLSKEIIELADLNAKPLNPGESVSERYRKIASLGKKLAEAFQALDAFMSGSPPDDHEPTEQAPDPGTLTTQTN